MLIQNDFSYGLLDFKYKKTPLTFFVFNVILLIMKKLFLFLTLFLVLIPLFSVVVPISEKIGTVAVDIQKDSVEEMILRAVNEEFTEEWVEKYAIFDNKEMFIVSYTPLLSTSLPLENAIISVLINNEIRALSLEDNISLTFIIKDGKIEGIL